MACVQDPSLTGAGSQNFQLSQKSKRSLRPIIPQCTLFSTDTPIYSAASLLFKNWKYVDDGVGNEEEWITLRRYLQIFFGSAAYDWILTLLLLLNVAIVVMEVDADARHEAPTSFVTSLSTAGSVIWLFEMVLRVWVFRLAMFRRLASLAEFLIVMVDCSVTFLGHTSAVAVLRVFRLTRLVRALRFVHLFPELHLMMKGLAGAFSVGLWGSIFLAFAILVWSIVFVVVVHPYNKVLDYGDCDRCPQAFGSVGAAFLTFAQSIVAGDSWGKIPVPVIEAEPLTMVLFIPAHVTLVFGVLNLIVVVLVDTFAEQRDRDVKTRLAEKQRHEREEKKGLQSIFDVIDTDGSGTLTADEVRAAATENSDFAARLRLMDVGQDDLSKLFEILDEDGSGDVDVHEFTDIMYRLRHSDSQASIIMLKHFVHDLAKRQELVQEAVSQMGQLGQMMVPIHSVKDHQTPAPTLPLALPSKGSEEWRPTDERPPVPPRGSSPRAGHSGAEPLGSPRAAARSCAEAARQQASVPTHGSRYSDACVQRLALALQAADREGALPSTPRPRHGRPGATARRPDTLTDGI